MRIFGVAVGEACRNACAMLSSSRCGLSAQTLAKALAVEADAGIAMHHERRAAIPSAHEFQQIGDMILVRHDVTIDRRGNVMQPQPEVVLLDDGARPIDPDFVADQRHDVSCAGTFDRLMQARERANVNHGIKLYLNQSRISAADGTSMTSGSCCY